MATTNSRTNAPAKGAAVLAALQAAIGAHVRAEAGEALARLAPAVAEVTAHKAAAEAEQATIDGLTQDQCEALVSGEKRLRQLAQSLRDRRVAHERLSGEEGAELKELRAWIAEARRQGLPASNEAVKEVSALIGELEAAKATRIRGIEEVLGSAQNVLRRLRTLPILGGWKAPVGPVADLVVACRAAAKEAGRQKAGKEGRKSFSTGPKPAEGTMAAAMKAAA